MKILFIGAIVTLLAMGCQNKIQSTPATTLTGNWEMTQSLIDIGNGQGTWQPADPAHKRTITFGPDSSYRDTDNPGLNRYSQKDADHIIVSGASNSFQMTIVSLSSDSLHLRAQCIEGCGEKFKRIK